MGWQARCVTVRSLLRWAGRAGWGLRGSVQWRPLGASTLHRAQVCVSSVAVRLGEGWAEVGSTLPQALGVREGGRDPRSLSTVTGWGR